MSVLKFKDYTFPPDVKVHVFDGKYRIRRKRPIRRLRGEGTLAGEGAYDAFKKLAAVFYDSSPGQLTHPKWGAVDAYFVALELEQEPKDDYVAYSFEFWEAGK